MENSKPSRSESFLDLLVDEVASRLEERFAHRHSEPVQPQVAVSISDALPMPDPALVGPEVVDGPLPELASKLVSDPEIFSFSHAASLMVRLAIGVLLVVILINIPLNPLGTALARSIPSSASLVIANGLLVKEATSPDVWVYRDGSFHWITTLEAFQQYGYRWQDVHLVEPGFLDDFEQGNPVYLLLKCNSSPHVYRLEEGKKRWIVDIPTFEAEGHVWRDVKVVPCGYLQSLPAGESIPPGYGSPPSP